MSVTLFTIGHSNHAIERFVDLLAAAGVTVVVDVRSRPWSGRHPQFGQARLRRSLADADIGYRFHGDALGARPDDPGCLVDGRASYARLGARPAFGAALDEVLTLAAHESVALMCAEREPLACHRTLLVSRHLAARGARIRHLLADGAVEPHEHTEDRLLAAAGLPAEDLFDDRAARLAAAYASLDPALRGP